MMTIKNNNEHGQKRYVERYMTDRRFSRIVGSLDRSYVLRHLHGTDMMDLNWLIWRLHDSWSSFAKLFQILVVLLKKISERWQYYIFLKLSEKNYGCCWSGSASN